MSTHRVEVIRVDSVEAHPNADALDLVRVESFTCAVRRGDFAIGDLAVYIEPDYVVPAEGPFAFLSKDGKPVRIKARRLRGIYSMGLLIKAPEGTSVGDDVRESLGIVRYEPTIEVSTSSTAEPPHPSLANAPKYDLESWRRYSSLFVEGERVIVTEKIHGANARYAWRDGRMWCGSRTQWKRDELGDLWWTALRQNAWIESWCREFSDCVVYGEVFGQVQDLKYGAGPRDVFFRAFDVLCPSGWVNAADLALVSSERIAPIVYDGPYDSEKLETLALADSVLPGAKHCAEGIVIKPAKERTDPHLGRVALKLVSNRYLEKAR